MSEIIWSKQARKDLKDIYDYISQDSLYFAERHIKMLLERVSSLSSQPTKGKLVAEYNSLFVRQLLAGKYRIIYNTSGPPNIEILRVLHSSRILKI